MAFRGIMSRSLQTRGLKNSMIRAFAGVAGTSGPTILYHIVITGQSNAVGANGLPILTTSTISNCKMFNGGLRAGGSGVNLASLVNMAEVAADATHGETIASAMAQWLSVNYDPLNFWLVSISAADDKSYSELKSGTTYFDDITSQIVAARARANELGLLYRCVGLCVVHGEKDQQGSNTTYGSNNLPEWYTDFMNVATLYDQTGDDQAIFICQQAGYPPSEASAGASTAFQVITAHLAQSLILPVAPRYCLDHRSVHTYNWGFRWLGEYYGKTIKKFLQYEVSLTNPVEGFRPSSASIVGSTIVLNLNVPVAPIQFKFNRVLYQPNYGFTYTEDAGTNDITDVSITGASQITITLSHAPSGTGKLLRYGYSGASSEDNSPNYDGGRGNIADSDSSTSRYGLPLENYLLQFELSL